ncbi:MAG: hypothetical protein AMXMBFR67_26800 [Nitrospira sp.]
MTTEQISMLVSRYLDATLEAGEDDRAMRDHISEAERESQIEGLSVGAEIAYEALTTNDHSKVRGIADDLLAESGMHLEPSSVQYRRLCRELLRAQIEVFEIEQERWGRPGRWASGLTGLWKPLSEPLGVTKARLEQPRAYPQDSPQEIPKETPTKLFSEVAAIYCQEHKRVPRYDKQVRVTFEKFLGIIGGDKPIGEICKADCRLYKQTLLKSVGDRRALGASTVNKRLRCIGHFWEWAQGQGFVPDEARSPVAGLTISARVEKKGKLERKPFTDADLKLILTHPTFIKQKTQRPERYWLVWILLATGARREEIAQLRMVDIQEEKVDSGETIHFFNITNEGKTQALKTAASKRRVPVHTGLVSLGFLEYVASMRRRKAERLFPGMRRTHNGYGDQAGQWFGIFIRSIGITDPGLVLHSLRHTVVTRLTAAGVPQEMREVLVGHATRGVHGQTYVHREGIPLALLKEHLEKLDFRGLLK